MAEVWVLHRTPEETLTRQRQVRSRASKARSRLVRADTIPYLRADEVAQWLPGSEDVVTLADRTRASVIAVVVTHSRTSRSISGD
ncbi:hypothetical protein [Streptomyces sp. NPDC054834]